MTELFQQLSDAMAAAVENVAPSLVSVHARRRMPATGVVWSDGVIVTAHHVVERDEGITIVDHDGNKYDAELIGRDPRNDIAVLKTDASLTPASQGDADALKVGQFVLALGKPGSGVQATLGVVSGIVSAETSRRRKEKISKRAQKHGGRRARRWVQRMGGMLVDGFIQTDVLMYPGFSGGPLLGADGSVYGMNTSGFRFGASIAVPLDTLASSVESLQAHGKMRQGYLGVGVQPVRLPDAIIAERDQETGLLVVSVENESPAAAAGLFVGDILVEIADDATEQIDELMAALSGDRVGTEVPVLIVRGGALQTLSVTIGERN